MTPLGSPVKIEPMLVAESWAATPLASTMIAPLRALDFVTLTNVPKLSVRFVTEISTAVSVPVPPPAAVACVTVIVKLSAPIGTPATVSWTPVPEISTVPDGSDGLVPTGCGAPVVLNSTWRVPEKATPGTSMATLAPNSP